MYAVPNTAVSLKLIWLILSNFGGTRESLSPLKESAAGATPCRSGEIWTFGARFGLPQSRPKDRAATGGAAR
jgi:hypothetical protein